MAREIVMPRLSDSMEEGTILKWLVAEGDELQEGQPMVEVETDKAVVTYEADAAATVLALAVDEGASVPVGAPIAIVGDASESLPQRSSPEALAAVGAPPRPVPPGSPGALGVASAPSAPSAPGPPSAPGAPAHREAPDAAPERVKASPLARRIAAELDVELAGLTGSGPNGRVIRSDVERAAGAGNGNGAAAAGMAKGQAGAAKGQATRQELTGMQRTVARRMAESRATVPDIELRSEVDMTEAVAVRDQLRGVSEDALPSLNDLIVKATALALVDFPRVNGSYRDSQFETYSRVNVGIAVAGEESLVVATIFDADTLSLGTIARTTRALAGRVRDGSITPGELAGATFSVSNLGMYGVDSFSAVINPPQAAILAVGAMRLRPVVIESDPAHPIAARQTIQLTLACDHRILYGVDGARFLSRVRELLERPVSLLL